jgi:AcrR family transcriptional regulator
MFVEHGYVGTTVDQIAERAGVSKPTVFASAGSKRSLLKDLCDLAIAGDDQPLPVVQRPWYQEALHEPDPARSLRLYGRNTVRIHERYADLGEVLRSAAGADDELRDLWRTSEDQRRNGASFIVDSLLRKGALKPGLERESAIDVLWVLTASDSFYRLVRVQGWSAQRYEHWLGDTFCDQLLSRSPVRR